MYDYPTDEYYDPNSAYQEQGYFDPYSGQYYDYENGEPEEDTDSAELRREQDRIEAIESNRLYLKKIRKQCVLEDFSDLEQKQLFLFEVLIESLEVDSHGDLGITSAKDDEEAYVIAQAQFLNSPYLEIREEESSDQASEYNEYLQTVNDAGQYTTAESYSPAAPKHTPSVSSSSRLEHRSRSSRSRSSRSRTSDEEKLETGITKLECDVKWENITGKSCMFSRTVREMIQSLDKYPVNIQVDRCVGQTNDFGPESREPLGYTSIRLPDEFAMSVLQSLKPGVVLPVTVEHRQADCDVRNVFGVKKGKVDVLLRLSSFGPVIITTVQVVDGERVYTYQPSPLGSFKDEKKEEQVNRSDLLKPLITDEENAIGITIPKKVDFFQKPVLWKAGVQCCECECDRGTPKISTLRGSDFDCMSLAKVPFSSDISLCRNVKSPTEQNTLRQFGSDLCDWHNLVGLEIKNNPGCHCPCALEGGDYFPKRNTDLVKKLQCGRIPYEPLPPIKGVGLKPEPTDCQCDCPSIKEALRPFLSPGYHKLW